MKRTICLLLTALMLCASAVSLAETLILEGQVVAARSTTVFAPIGGAVKAVEATVGDRVEAADVLFELRTEVVRAEQSGRVAVFGQAGDTTAAIAAKYGAVVMLEQDSAYTISASTGRSYDRNENKLIHPGEAVYLRSVGENKTNGKGLVTGVTGSEYTVLVTDGEYDLNESINIYRSKDRTTDSRIGQGSLRRANPIAYTGSGAVVRYLVQNGDHVEKGQALFETLTGVFAPEDAVTPQVLAGETGVLAALNVSGGSTVSQFMPVAEIYPDSAMRVKVSVSENDLNSLAVGDRVQVEMDAWPDELLGGTVEKIGMLSEGAAADAMYAVYITLDDIQGVRYGMHATVTTGAADEAPVEEELPDEAPAAAAEE